MPRSATPRARHALLIGIDRYAYFPPASQLKGCCRDVELVHAVLRQRFQFRKQDIQVLRNQHATRDGILLALAALEERAGEGDLVVLQFSGHGSTRRDDGVDEPDGRDETFVPHDSGRGEMPNRDLADDELAAWVWRINCKTPHLTLIFDSCHAGTIVRDDAFGARVRQLPSDERPVARQRRPPASKMVSVAGGLRGAASTASGGYALLAACSHQEHAHELHLEGGGSCGAFTYFLCQELAKMGEGESYRELFERISAQVNARFSAQHPQLEGARERQVLGVEELPPMRFVPVTVRAQDHVELGAGAAHGVVVGSEWRVYPPGTRSIHTKTPPLGRLRVDDLKATRALAEVIEGAAGQAVVRGARAVEDVHAYAPLRLAVEVRDAAARPQRQAAMVRCALKSKLLRPVKAGEGAELCVYLLPAREDGEGEPVPQLGALAADTWAVVDRAGTLVMPPRPALAPGAVAAILANLETCARFRYALQLENRIPSQALAGCVDLELLRWDGGQWSPAEAGGEPELRIGERVALAVRHRHATPLFITLLSFGLDGSIHQVYPPPGAREPLVPDRELRIGASEEDELRVFLPAGVPFEGGDFQRGVEYFKLFATTVDTDFQVLLQSGVREGPEPSPGSLQSLLVAVAKGHRNVRHAAQESWTTVVRTLRVVAAPGGASKPSFW